jgi:hypothetical protein
MSIQRIILYFIALSFCITLPQNVLSQLTPAEQQQILTLHNNARRSANPPASNMIELVWDTELAAVATEHAAKCLSTPSTNQYGENVAAGGWNGRIDLVMDAWTKGDAYNFAEGKCSGSCGTYLTVMLAGTEKLGCARSSCANNTQVYVCNYAPLTYSLTERPYTEGPAGTNCPTGFTAVNGLCRAAATTAPATAGTTAPTPHAGAPTPGHHETPSTPTPTTRDNEDSVVDENTEEEDGTKLTNGAFSVAVSTSVMMIIALF